MKMFSALKCVQRWIVFSCFVVCISTFCFVFCVWTALVSERSVINRLYCNAYCVHLLLKNAGEKKRLQSFFRRTIKISYWIFSVRIIRQAQRRRQNKRNQIQKSDQQQFRFVYLFLTPSLRVTFTIFSVFHFLSSYFYFKFL